MVTAFKVKVTSKAKFQAEVTFGTGAGCWSQAWLHGTDPRAQLCGTFTELAAFAKLLCLPAEQVSVIVGFEV
jgi:hypothetical protein